MVFKKRSENNGLIDENINQDGQPRKPQQMTRREKREREQLVLLRKFKPLVADAVNTAAKVMRNDKAAEQHRLKAVSIIIDTYRELVCDVYEDVEDDQVKVPDDVQPKVAFSLHMIPPKTDTVKE